MLPSYGTFVRSLSTRHVRYATTVLRASRKPRSPKAEAKDISSDGQHVDSDEQNTKKPEKPKGLSEIQAHLEATGYSRRKNAAILKPKKDAPINLSKIAKVKDAVEADTTVDPETLEQVTEVTAVAPAPKPSRKKAAKPVPKDDVKSTTTRKAKIKSDTDLEPPTRAKKKAKMLAVEGPTTASPKTPKRQPKKLNILPPRLMPPIAQKHHDLASFLAHVELTKSNTKSTTYVGTHFEYTVAQSLLACNFTLQRTGRSNDLGIDLIGHWNLPAQHHNASHTMPVIIQCKASKTTPAEVRELEGAYVGAPAGWRGHGVLAMLVSMRQLTKGVLEAVQRSRWPMAVMHVQRDGVVKRFVWNAVAAEQGLEGLGVALEYSSGDGGAQGDEGGESMSVGVGQTVALTWMGKVWRPVRRGRVESTLIATAPGDSMRLADAVAS